MVSVQRFFPIGNVIKLHWQAALILIGCLVHLADIKPSLATDLESKRSLEHEDYARWNEISGSNISEDGKWISYRIVPGDGNATLMLREVETDQEYAIVRGNRLRFTKDSQHAIFVVEPDPELVKQVRKEKKPDQEIPKEKLVIFHLESGSQVAVENVRRFSLPEESSDWVAFPLIEEDRESNVEKSKSGLTETYEIRPGGFRRLSQHKQKQKPKSRKHAETPEEQKPSSESAKREEQPAEGSPKEQKKASDKEKELGSTLVLRNLETHVEQRFPFVVNYRFDEAGEQLAFATSAELGEDDGVYVFDLKELQTRQILAGRGNYGQVVFSQDGRQLAFLTNRDDYAAEQPAWSIYLWKRGRREAQELVAKDTDGIPPNWVIASSSAPMFTHDERRLIFRTRPEPEPTEEADDDDEPVAKLDLWHWQDPYLQPEQLLRADRERNRSYEAVFDLRGRKAIQLETKEISSVSLDPESEAEFVLGTASDAYNKMLSWDRQSYSDWYLIHLRTGEHRKLAEKKRGQPRLSPAGKYVTWWDGEERTWYGLPAKWLKADEELPEPIDLAVGIGHPVHDELHDQPSLPRPYGLNGWLADDAGLLIRDRWDIWLVDPSGEHAPKCITGHQGREQEISFDLERLDSEERYVDLEQTQILQALVHETKSSGYYSLSPGEEAASDWQLQPLIMLDERISGLRKAKQADQVMFTRSTFERFPDLWASTLEFEQARRISRANPQQDEYLWGTAELVRWKAKDGQPLDGLLYKPEGFDPERKYPLLVYFYERNADNLHRHYVPAAGRSIINFSFYVSRGYVIFVPDIPYKVGEPGPSAANAVLPGVEHVIDMGFIDEERIGMQGHSWGGYQTAYLVTVSDMFACAESGAPVSNMTSAYGGIRWGSGLSRMFQYEKTQSRIGGTLWEARRKYIENSPLFFADKISTPLLILHNDEDTAVPWYQGIELFVALRRLEKPAWMLNYNGEPHWVMKDENRLDFAKRMQQFFDHYLKGEPMPIWMAEGIPAVDKGKEFGFEYIEPEETHEPETAGQAEE